MDSIIVLNHLFTPKIKIIFEQRCMLIFILIISTEYIWINSRAEATSPIKLWKSKEGHETGYLLWRGVNRTNANDPSMYPEVRNGIVVLEEQGIRSPRINESANKNVRYLLPNDTESDPLNRNETEAISDTDAEKNVSSTVTTAANLRTNMSRVQSNISESQTHDYNNISAEVQVTTNEYRTHENITNITTIESLQNNLLSDIRPFVVIDVDNNNVNKSLDSYGFHRRQATGNKSGRWNVYNVNNLSQNISKDNRLKYLKNGKSPNILHARDVDINLDNLNNNYMNTYLNDYKKQFMPLSQSKTDTREVNQAFSQQMKSNVEPANHLFNKWKIFMPDVNFLDGKDSSLGKYKNKFLPFPQKTNFIFKDMPENSTNKPKSPFIDNLSTNEHIQINRDQFIQPHEMMNINKNDFYGRQKIPLLQFQYMNNKSNSRNLPGTLNNRPPVEINYLMIKIPHSPVKTPSYGMFTPLSKNYQVKTEMPFLKITEEIKDEKPQHINENVNKYAKEMRIKGPPSEFVEFMRPDLYVAAPEHKEVSPYTKNQMLKRSHEKVLKSYRNHTVSGKEHSKNHNGLAESTDKIENKYIRHETSPMQNLKIGNNKRINKINIHKIQLNDSNPLDDTNSKKRRVSSREMHKNSTSDNRNVSGSTHMSHSEVKKQVSNVNVSPNSPVTNRNHLQSDSKIVHKNIQEHISSAPWLSPKAVFMAKYVTPLEFTTKGLIRATYNAQLMQPGQSDEHVRHGIYHRKTDMRFEKDLNNNNQAYDIQYMSGKEPYEHESENRINDFPAESVPWEVNQNGISQFSPYVRNVNKKDPASQILSENRRYTFSRNEYGQPSLESYNPNQGIKSLNQREKEPPTFSINKGRNVQISQPLTKEQGIYPQNEDFPFVTKYVNDEFHTKMLSVNEFDSSMDPFDVTSIVEVKKFFQSAGETTVSTNAQKQSMPMAIGLEESQNPVMQIGEIPDDGDKQVQIQTEKTLLFGSPYIKTIVNNDNNITTLQPQIQAKVRSLGHLPFDIRPISGSPNQFAISKFEEPQNNEEYVARIEPDENAAPFKEYGNAIGIKPPTMEFSTNKTDVMKEIDTIQRKTEIENIQIQKEIALKNKDIENNTPQSKQFSFGSDKYTQSPSPKTENLSLFDTKYIQSYPPPTAEKPLPFDDKYVQAYSPTAEKPLPFGDKYEQAYSPTAEKPLPFDDKYVQTYSPAAEEPLPFGDKHAQAYSLKTAPSLYDDKYNVPAVERNTIPLYEIYTQLPKGVNNMNLYANYQPKSSEQLTAGPVSNYLVNTTPSNNGIENLPEALHNIMSMKNKGDLNDVTSDYKTTRYEVVPELINFQITVHPYKERLGNNQEVSRQHEGHITSPLKKVIKISEKEIEILSPKKTDGIKEISRLEQILGNDDDEVNDISDNCVKIKKRGNNEFQHDSDLISKMSPQSRTENEQNFYNETQKVPENSELLINPYVNVNTMRKPLALSYLSDDGDQVKNNSTGIKQLQTISSKLFTFPLKPLMKTYDKSSSEIYKQLSFAGNSTRNMSNRSNNALMNNPGNMSKEEDDYKQLSFAVISTRNISNLSNSVAFINLRHILKGKDDYKQLSFANITTRNVSGIVNAKIKLFIGSFDKLFRLLKKSMVCTLLIAVTGVMIVVSIFIIFALIKSYCDNRNRLSRVYNIDSQVSRAERGDFYNEFHTDESILKSIRRYFRILPYRLFMPKFPDDSRMQFHI